MKIFLKLFLLAYSSSDAISLQIIKQLIKTFTIDGKEVTVYTTAENSDLRLTETSKEKFEPADQPLESEVSIFVNPNKKFQTFWGIGGAITDASAEVFAKLSEEKQEELLKCILRSKRWYWLYFS